MRIAINGEIVDSESAAAAFRMTRLQDICALQARIQALDSASDDVLCEDELIETATFYMQDARHAQMKLLAEIRELDDKLAAS